jgi:glyoxylase-like metal-dependent hydrolase (beta-lactamase superfamily II)
MVESGSIWSGAVDLVVHPFFDPETFSYSYVLANPSTGNCAIIDPVLDYDLERGEVATRSADRIAELIEVNDYAPEWILETHVHADHLSAARYLKERFVCAQIAVGERVREVQSHFAAAFEIEIETEGRQFDRLLKDGERLCLGHACGRVIHTPGHTPACVSFFFDRFVFVGDTLFMPDYGTARCDFPGGDARALYRSVQTLYQLPERTQMLMCHDYAPGGRDYRFCTTVAEQRQSNLMLSAAVPETAFVKLRGERDQTLAAPRLLIPAVRANVAGGVLPGWVLEPHLQDRLKAEDAAA